MAVVSDYTALISGYSWNGMTDPGAPVFVSYTFLDNDDHTLMSYTRNGVYDTTLAHLDIDALQHQYSDQTTINESWGWSDVTEIFTLSGAATGDTLIGIDAVSTISGLGGNDTLWARDAADTLIGGVGNDTLNGGAGSDTAVFSGNRSEYSIAEFGILHRKFE